MFEFDHRQIELYQRYQSLGQQLGANVSGRETSRSLSRRDWQTCADQGVLGLLVPSAYGGSEIDPVSYARALEGLGYGCVDNGLLMAISAHVLAVEVPIRRFGNEWQCQRYLPGLVSGAIVGSHAITESEAGSDALALATTAERDGTSYRLTGAKRFATNAPLADLFLVYATIDTALGFTGVTAFLVERDDPGVHVREGVDKMGLRTAPWGDIELDGCCISEARRLGREKQGRFVLEHVMAWERSLILAPWVGVLDREVQACVRYSHERRQFGRRISQFQAVSHRLVDMALDLESSRLLVHRAAAALAAEEQGAYPEMAKLFASEAAVRILSSALQVYGALGYTVDRPVERHLRDAYGMTISSGTSDMQRSIIGGRLDITTPVSR